MNERHLTKSEAFRILSEKLERQKRVRKMQELHKQQRHFEKIVYLTTGGFLAALLLLTGI